MHNYWQKQTKEIPLFENILWSRPETKAGAGKLLIVGGNAHGFSNVGLSYREAEKAGAGHIRLLLPNALAKVVGPLGPYEYVASTPSGSFGREALSELLISASWSDTVLLVGDLGRNSETAILLESFVQKYSGKLTLTKDAVDYFYALPEIIANRPNTCLVLSLAQLQKLAMALKFEIPFLLSMGLMLLVQALHQFTLKYPVIIVTRELDQIVVAQGGRVSTTKLAKDNKMWRAETAAKTSVFWLQNAGKPFESITSALIF